LGEISKQTCEAIKKSREIIVFVSTCIYRLILFTMFQKKICKF